MQIRATMLTIKLIYREHVWYYGFVPYCSKVIFLFLVNVFAVLVYIKKKLQQCKLQRLIPAMCNWTIREKAPRIQLQPLLTTTTLVSSHSDLHWCWPCCFWPLHLNLLYTDSLAHTMHETSSATANVITLLLYCFMHTINPLRTVYFRLVPQPVQTFFFVYPCVCNIIIINNISSHLSQHPSVDKKLGSKHL